ncbi:monodechloroaminopyrrolnitrin synthase PrnB family protein [Streptomyces sp. NPDC017435]|uniref:monodechloroaminopyrrolnitrin synthase PrnB family protein n=1 Tax=Streptomyces sp. NPDC017435 TaxID=3364995 RepID=UPI00378AFEE2
MLTVKRTLTPHYFTGLLRPYYPPLEIDGRTYYAPGGAQMPLLVLDVLILSQAATGELAAWYEQYLTDNVLYLPPHHRALVDAGRRSPGLARLAHRRTHLQPAAALLIDDLLRFRLPHRQLARANMAVRADGSLGSGGYTTSALDRLLDVTDSARALLNPGTPHEPLHRQRLPALPARRPTLPTRTRHQERQTAEAGYGPGTSGLPQPHQCHGPGLQQDRSQPRCLPRGRTPLRL